MRGKCPYTAPLSFYSDALVAACVNPVIFANLRTRIEPCVYGQLSFMGVAASIMTCPIQLTLGISVSGVAAARGSLLGFPALGCLYKSRRTTPAKLALVVAGICFALLCFLYFSFFRAYFSRRYPELKGRS